MDRSGRAGKWVLVLKDFRVVETVLVQASIRDAGKTFTRQWVKTHGYRHPVPLARGAQFALH